MKTTTEDAIASGIASEIQSGEFGSFTPQAPAPLATSDREFEDVTRDDYQADAELLDDDGDYGYPKRPAEPEISVTLPGEAVNYSPEVGENVTLIECPQAVSVILWGCEYALRIVAPLARYVSIEVCTHALETLFAPLAETVYLDGCESLEELDLPSAKKINIRHCESLRKLMAPLAEQVELRDCQSLAEAHLPNARDGEMLFVAGLYPESATSRMTPKLIAGAYEWNVPCPVTAPLMPVLDPSVKEVSHE